MDTRETQIFAKAADTGGYVTIATGTTPSERLRVDGSGNVQITNTNAFLSFGADATDANNGAIGRAEVANYHVTGSAVGDLTVRAGASKSIVFGTSGSLGLQPTERMRIDASGNVGIGTSSPSAKLEVDGAASTDGILITNPLSGSFYNAKVEFRRDSTAGGAKIQTERNSAGGVGLSFNVTADNTAEVNATYSQAMTIDRSGNVLVGTTNNAYSHIAVFDGSIGVVSDGNSTRCFEAFLVSNENWNVSDTAVRVGKNGTTSRSINAGGTINASGADYAEYMKKADSCGTIAKGDVCGVDSTGKLTDVFADAISFVIKSTDPSYVGGDAWGDVDLGLTEEQTETERQKYDRIAFSGQVPVNITGSFNVGDYVYPQVNGTAIECVAKSSPTFEEYQLCVGKIWATQDDGRPFVAVKIG